MKTYEKYKNSGVSWLGKIPEHWEWRKLGKYCQIIMGQSPKGESVNEVDGIEFHQGKIFFGERFVQDSKIKTSIPTKIAPADSVLLSVRAPVGKVNITDREICIGRGLAAIKTSDGMPTLFLFFLLQTLEEIFNSKATGSTFKAINIEKIYNQLIPVPPLAEQEAIVKFLDYKVSRIEKLILIRECQIVNLKELKKAVINKAVTKGDWKRVRLKNLVKLINEKTSLPSLKYIGMENIESWTGKLIETKEIIPESVSNKFYKGDILFGKLRPYLAKVFLAPIDGICSSEFLVLRSKEEIEAKFLQYYLISYKFIDIVNSSTYGAKMPRANWQFIGNYLIHIPPLNEQNEIAEYLDKKCGQIDKLERVFTINIASVTGCVCVRFLALTLLIK
ncbi:MAG: restriction endonuclease subunit S, partial [Synergistaceae bacterium]|nr:restriction endonuclease subunit S [Synergistaceae bacterium]